MSLALFDFIGGPLLGYKIALFPANLSLIYIWHPLFTEEIALLPKLALMLLGQFVIVSMAAAILLKSVKLVETINRV